MYSLLYSINIYIIVSKLINSLLKLTITSSSRPLFPSLPRTCVTQLSFSSWDRRSDVMVDDPIGCRNYGDDKGWGKFWRKDLKKDNKLSLRIQSPCQMMIGVYNHLLRKVFRFHYQFQKVIGSLDIPRSKMRERVFIYLVVKNHFHLTQKTFRRRRNVIFHSSSFEVSPLEFCCPTPDKVLVLKSRSQSLKILNQMGVSKNRGIYPKMDGENYGKPF